MYRKWDEEADVVVVGSGAGGMAAALFAAKKGLRVVLCEKTAVLGGTTATSGGIAWIPNTAEAQAAGVRDSVEAAREYLRAELGDYYRSDLVEAYLSSGPEALAALQDDTEVRFDLARSTDHHSRLPGALSSAGRCVEARRFDGRKLGKDFNLLRTPIRTLMLFGKLSVDRRRVDEFLNPFSSAGSIFRIAATFIRLGTDLLRFPRGTDIGGGNALVARLLLSLRDRNVTIWTDTPLRRLVGDPGGVAGIVVSRDGTDIRVRARKAVILATGGFPHNRTLREEFGCLHPKDSTAAYEGNTGDGIVAARQVGAAVDTNLQGGAIWAPMSKFVRKGVEETILYGYLDRGRPGVIAVDGKGKRFVNESDAYHDIVRAIFADGWDQDQRFYFICDRRFIWKRGLGLIKPYRLSLRKYIKARYVIAATTLADLARKIDVPAETFVETVERHNGFARTGRDLDFHRGETAYNNAFGDPSIRPNPNLAPIEAAPFFALPIYPGILSTCIGLKTTDNAEVVSEANQPIPGLYACGNDLASVMRGGYPCSGVTIGPAIAFSYRAVNHIAG